MELGRHHQVIPELRALVTQEPLRERLHRLLMLALYRARSPSRRPGRVPAGPDPLVDELGVEPGPELRELQRAVLDRSPRLDPAPSAQFARPRQLPPRQLPGRDRRLHRPRGAARRDPPTPHRGRAVQPAHRRHLRPGRGRQVHARGPCRARAHGYVPGRALLRRCAGDRWQRSGDDDAGSVPPGPGCRRRRGPGGPSGAGRAVPQPAGGSARAGPAGRRDRRGGRAPAAARRVRLRRPGDQPGSAVRPRRYLARGCRDA